MNLDRIEAILQLLQRQQHVGEVAVEGEGWRIQARKGQGIPTMMPDFKPEEITPADEPCVVRAERVGIYRAPRPTIAPGDHVKRGAVLGKIDSMRIENPVVAEQGGRVVEVHVEDGFPVEFGQELFVLAPEGPLASE